MFCPEPSLSKIVPPLILIAVRPVLPEALLLARLVRTAATMTAIAKLITRPMMDVIQPATIPNIFLLLPPLVIVPVVLRTIWEDIVC